MRLGITGHQYRPEVDWNWVKQEIDNVFVEYGGIDRAYSSLAAGADQVFAEIALKRGAKLVAVIPLENYERFFDDASKQAYERLLPRAEQILLKGGSDPEKAFFDAGKYIVDNTDELIAVWDSKPAQGLGGTADIVSYARANGRPILHLDPIGRSRRLI